jgi:hypothetical protein
MALTKTLAEIQEVLPKLVSSQSDFSILNNFDRIENKYIIPLIGRTLYDALQAAYDDETLDAEEIKLVKHIRLVTGAYSFYDELGQQLLTFSDNGLKKIVQGGNDRIYHWEIKETKNGLLKSAYDGIEVLLNYLFDQKDLYPDWTASDQYKKISGLLVRTGTELANCYSVFQPQRCYFLMRGQMETAQLLAIQEDIGEDLLVYLRDKETPHAEEIKCIDLLKKALSLYTIQKACISFSVDFSDSGFTILGDKEAGEYEAEQPIDTNLLELKMKELGMDAESFLELAKNKLVAFNSHADVSNDYKTALAAGPLASYIQPADRTSGNENRHSFSFI